MEDVPKGIHEHKDKLFCNKCNRKIDKFRETLVYEGEVWCLICNNWLCGEFDGFGIKEG